MTMGKRTWQTNVAEKSKLTESLSVREEIMADLKEISGQKCKIWFNDVYETKKNMVRRLKIVFEKGWIKKEEWQLWKEEFESKRYGNYEVEFTCVDKVLSVGGWEAVKENRELWIEVGRPIEKFDDIFYNQDLYFVVKIKVAKD